MNDCSDCKSTVDNGYRLGKLSLCDQCYENRQRRAQRDRLESDGHEIIHRMYQRERTGELRRRYGCCRLVQHHD